jgi:purine-binding chemotaxis protein CheW
MDLSRKAEAGAHEFIAFRVGGKEFCLDIMMVREIRGWTPATLLPMTPNYVRGVINLRGAVLPIVEFSARLGLPSTEPTERNVIIVVQSENRQVGLLVDAVSDILSVDDASIQPPPEVASSTVKTFVRGLLSVDGRMISLISLENLLQSGELATA